MTEGSEEKEGTEKDRSVKLRLQGGVCDGKNAMPKRDFSLRRPTRSSR